MGKNLRTDALVFFFCDFCVFCGSFSFFQWIHPSTENGNKEEFVMAEAQSCCAGPKLIFACSGAADVGGIADQAARKLTREGAGKMFCLAGVGGRISGIMETTRAASDILAIDGCGLDCAKNCLEQAGFVTFQHLRMTDLGMEKGSSPVTEENIAKVAEKGAALLAAVS